MFETVAARRGAAITAMATATMAISYLDRQVLAALSPTLRGELGLTPSDYGQVVSAFSLAYLVAAPAAGRWLERVGVRRGLLAAVAVWTVVSALHAFVPTFGVLIALRLALGVAEAPSFPGSSAAIARTVDPAKRARSLGFLYTGSSIGAMLAPPLAVWLAGKFGWRNAFVGVAIVGTTWIPLWLLATRSVREKLDAPASDVERPSALAVLLKPAVLRACALTMAASPVFAFIILWGSEMLVSDYGVVQADVGRYLVVPPLFFDVGAVLFGWLASRHAERRGVRSTPLGLAAVAIAIAFSLSLLPLCTGPWSMIAVASVTMFGGGGIFAILSSDLITRVGPGLAASAGGITAGAQSLAYVIANLLIGRGVEHFGSHAPVAVALAFWMLPGALLWLASGRAPIALSEAGAPAPSPPGA